MQAHTKLVTTPEEASALAQILSSHSMIALDTEFIRETTFFPIVALIQVATETESWLIDPLAFGEGELKPVLDVFTNPKIVKILHAAQADQECLYTNYGVVASPSFDTAAGASLCGLGDSIGLSKLVKEMLGVQLQKGHARTDWTARPMPEQLMKYAHLDVQYLIELATKLMSQLDKQGRKEWAFELSARYEDTRAYEPNAEGLTRKLSKSGKLDRRGLATLKELVAWREKRVRELDVPRRRVADDDTLVALASTRPKDLNHLAAFRGLNRGELKASGEAILAAVRRGMQVPDADLPDVLRPDIASDSEARAVELIQCFVKIRAEDLQISPRHLMTGDDVLPILRHRINSIDQLVSEGILTAGAAKLIGEELLAMVHGRRSLSVQGGRVVVLSTT